MIKVGKILGIMEILGGFFLIFLLLWIFCGEFLGALGALGALGVWGRWWGLGLGGGWRQPASLSALSAPSARMIRKCGVWGWGFFVGGLGFFCKFAEMYGFF